MPSKKIKCPVDRDHLTKRREKVIRNSAECIIREITFVDMLRKIDTLFFLFRINILYSRTHSRYKKKNLSLFSIKSRERESSS